MVSTQKYLGGIPMISNDMMNYIKMILLFGIGVFFYHLTMVYLEFKWVVMPLLGCVTSVIIMVGCSFNRVKVTVSSNFIALMLFLIWQ